MTTTTAIETTETGSSYSYDEIPYESYPFAQSHPDRLATLATLFGMKPQPINDCRVLELGSASGGNLIPMAAALPGSKFVGIDLSEMQIKEGNKAIDSLGLKNIELKHMSIMDIDENFGTFDYIIAHGVYSWVPDNVQAKMLKILQDCLAPQGVGYISYNTYPGWHYRGMIRDMMLYHTGHLPEAKTKAVQARALLDFLNQAVPTENNAFGIMLKNEVDLLRRQKDYYLLHDYLEEANSPVYFHQFASRAGECDLQYLAEADFSTMLASNFPKQVSDTLMQIANDIVRTEQYMDFVRNRTFRQTLLCRKDVQLTRNLTPESVTPLCVAAPAKPENEKFDPNSQQPEKFSMPDGKIFTSSYPLVRAAFHHLHDVWPQCVQFDDLLATARSMLGSVRIQESNTFQLERQTLAGDLLTCYTIGISTFRTLQLPFVRELGDHPKVSALARYQADHQPMVTNQLHETVAVDAFAIRLLKLLDGTRDKSAILTGLVEFAKSGDLLVQKDGKVLTDDALLRESLEKVMDERMSLLPKSALLVNN